MFRKKNGQEFMDERNVDSSVNDKKRKRDFFTGGRRKRLIYMKMIWAISRRTVIFQKKNMIKN